MRVSLENKLYGGMNYFPIIIIFSLKNFFDATFVQFLKMFINSIYNVFE